MSVGVWWIGIRRLPGARKSNPLGFCYKANWQKVDHMNLFDKLKSIIKRALHVRPAQLKGAPGLHAGQEDAAAAAINALLGTAVDSALAAGPGVVEHALHIKPEQLKGTPGVKDHEAAADHVNGLVQGALGS